MNVLHAANEKVVFDLKENNVDGLPDGMTIDTDGNLWVACFYGSQVSLYIFKVGENSTRGGI